MDDYARFVDWGHWGITFWNGIREDQSSWQAVCKIQFPVGPRGPMDGFIGSAERTAYADMCLAWNLRGEIPEGAACHIDQRWLFDPSHLCAQWLDGYGWESSVFKHGVGWVFPSQEGMAA